MKIFFSNVRNIIWSGFGIIIALMIVLSIVVFYQLNDETNRFKDVVEINNTKIGLVHMMSDAIHLRSLSINKMALSDDIFFRDDEKLLFNIYANRFIRALDQFNEFDLNKTEIEYLQNIQAVVDIGYSLNQKALGMLLNDDEMLDILPIIQDSLIAQESILKGLTRLVQLQESYAISSVAKSKKDMEYLFRLLIIFISISIVFSIVISQSVSKIVTGINNRLSYALEIKSMFLANMSHEIRTPLTAIIGFAKSQMIPNLPDDHNERATKIILRNSEHLLKIINDILDFTKLESDKLSVEYNDFSLFELLDDIQLITAGTIGEKAVTFSINYNYPLPDRINSDETRLKQILLNLSSNAVKFTNEGFINLNIRYDRASHDLYFDMYDSGIGLTDEQQRIIFDNFNQADISITRKYGGTGLGLTISKALVKKLGGELKVSSEHGVGSCFTFTIHNQISEDDTKIKYINNIVDTLEIQHSAVFQYDAIQVEGKILLVEDTLDNQELIAFHLEEMGARVTIVDNGKKAVTITATTRFDLILMDMQMPIMGGIEATEKIRKRGDKVPIVMVTANATDEDKDRSLASGCNYFLAKPIAENEFIFIVGKFLKIKQIKDVDAATVVENKQPDADIPRDIDVIVSTLMEKNPTKYNKFITKFVNYLPTYVDEFSEYIKNKNDIELKAVAHKLKGVGGNMGYMILTEISRNFEIAIQQGNRDEIARLFEELKIVAQKIYRGNEPLSKNITG